MRALVSVYDKSGLDKICKILISLNFEIFSTGGTFDYLKKSGIQVKSIFDAWTILRLKIDWLQIDIDL